VTGDLASVPWRTGGDLGCALYARTSGGSRKADTYIGVLDTPELAEAACSAHNAELVRRKAEAAAPEDAAYCPCGHGPDDLCLNGLIYGSCGDENCGGGCTDVDTCKVLPGCCGEGRP
jgi:hypothetical protein